MLDILKKTLIEGEIVSIYTNQEDPECYSVGFLQEIDEETFLLNHITPYGLYDGYLVKKLNKIYRVEKNGNYEQKISKLYSAREQNHLPVDIENNDIIFSLLKHAKLNELFVSIEIGDNGFDDIQGKVKELSDTIQILKYDDYGEKNGDVCIYKSDISALCCNTEDEMILKILSDC